MMLRGRAVLAAVEFARATFVNDGAEGETVHLLCDAIEQLLADHADDERRLKQRDAILEERSGDIEQLVAEVAKKDRMLEELAARIYEWQVRLNSFSQALGNIYKTSEAGRPSQPAHVGLQLIPMFEREPKG